MRIVFDTARYCGYIDPALSRDDIHVNERTDGTFRIVLNNTDSDQSALFSDAVWEIMGPVQNHKYVVEYREYESPLSEITREQLNDRDKMDTVVTGCYPVPSLFSKNRNDADIFHTIWMEYMGDCAMHYTRHGEGCEFVKKWIGKRSVELRREMKTVWE